MQNPGLRSKNRSPDEAADQLFPRDGLSVFGGVVLTLFVAVVLVSIAMVCVALKLVCKTTIQAVQPVVITDDMANTIKQQWAQQFPGVVAPVNQDSKTGQWTVKAVVSAKLGDLNYGTADGLLACTSGPMYVILTILTLFALFWAVRGKPTYVGVVQAMMIGLAWLCAAILFAIFYPRAITPPANYLADLKQKVASGQVYAPNFVLPSNDILNRQSVTTKPFVQAFVYGSIGLLALFGLIVIIARSTPYAVAA